MGEPRVLKTFRRLFDLLDRRERQRFWLLCAMILAMGLLEVAGVASVLPFLAVLSNREIIETNALLATLYDRLGFTDANHFLVFLGAGTFLVIFSGQIFKAATIYALTRYSRMREYSIGSRLLGAYLRQPYAWFLGRHSSDLAKSILSEVNNVTMGVMVPALRLLAYGTVAVLLVMLLMLAKPVPALAGALIVGGGYLITFVATRRYLARIGAARLRANAERFKVAQEAFGGVKDLKLRALEEPYLQRFRRPSARFAHYQAIAAFIQELPRFLLEAVVFGAMIVFLLVLLLTTEGQLEQALPVVGMFAFAGTRLFPALQNIYRALSKLRFNRAVLDALHADFQQQLGRPPMRRGGGAAPLRLRERLELVDVHYNYPGVERSALGGLDLKIEAKTTVGLVGATGAGKTTAVDIILGLLTPERGAVVVDGEAIDETNLRAWQSTLGYVPQQIFLTDDSIAANIALGVPPDGIDMAAVERAARIAELHDLIVDELPSGYATTVGERGVRLSGGQRQRIGIARALYHDPDVLILDEATSALDNLTERAVMDAVHNLGHAKTIIMIAHRLTTVRDCDTIFMLEQGRCTAAGSYDRLFAGHDSFRELASARL